MRFRIMAVVEVSCERFIEADNFSDAEAKSESMSVDEWLHWSVESRIAGVTDVYEDPKESVNPAKIVNPKGKRHSKKKNKK